MTSEPLSAEVPQPSAQEERDAVLAERLDWEAEQEVATLDAARAQGRAETLDVALGRLTEDDLHYEYGYSAGGEPLDPELFVHYEHLRSALAAIKENQP
jgi:hypothetical protein